MSDLALKSMGMACAAGSVWFAVHMFNHQEGGPRINAMEDFAIFAQPNRVHAVEAAVRAAAVESTARKAARSITIDMTPIGAVPAHPAPKPAAERQDIKIVELTGDDVLLETREGYRRLRVGDESPEIGRVLSIRRMGEYWVVVATQRSLAQVAPARVDEDSPRAGEQVTPPGQAGN